MKLFLLIVFLCTALIDVNSQAVKTTVLNDTTELQEYGNGEKLKITYWANNRIMSIREKNLLLEENPGVRQSFNIKNVNNELIGEVIFGLDKENRRIKYELNIEPPDNQTIDITRNLQFEQFPPFTWTTLTGSELSLDELKGKTVVLNFWHTSCIPCIAEMPLLNELVKKYEGKPVEFIASTPNTKEELLKFLQHKKFSFSHVPLVDPKTIFDPFPGWPIHIVVNRNGTILFHALGKQKDIEKKLEKSIEESLAETK